MNRYTLGGDDEVVLQTPYDQEEMHRVGGGGRGSSCVIIQEDGQSSGPAQRRVIHIETSSSVDMNVPIPLKMIGTQNQHHMMANTLQLENSMESALHMVSFFSGDDEAGIVGRNNDNKFNSGTSSMYFAQN